MVVFVNCPSIASMGHDSWPSEQVRMLSCLLDGPRQLAMLVVCCRLAVAGSLLWLCLGLSCLLAAWCVRLCRVSCVRLGLVLSGWVSAGALRSGLACSCLGCLGWVARSPFALVPLDAFSVAPCWLRVASRASSLGGPSVGLVGRWHVHAWAAGVQCFYCGLWAGLGFGLVGAWLWRRAGRAGALLPLFGHWDS